MILEAKDLTFRYPRQRGGAAVERVSLTLRSGERVGLSAPSGRGKTTLCKLLAGWERPERGQVLLDGAPLPSQGFCPVQLLWQHPEEAVDPLLRLGTTLYEAGPVDPAAAEGLGIQPGWLERYPMELSGGDSCCATRRRPCWTWSPRPGCGGSSWPRRRSGTWACWWSAMTALSWSRCVPGFCPGRTFLHKKVPVFSKTGTFLLFLLFLVKKALQPALLDLLPHGRAEGVEGRLLLAVQGGGHLNLYGDVLVPPAAAAQLGDALAP